MTKYKTKKAKLLEAISPSKANNKAIRQLSLSNGL
jgi:hypothetical protein